MIHCELGRMSAVGQLRAIVQLNGYDRVEPEGERFLNAETANSPSPAASDRPSSVSPHLAQTSHEAARAPRQHSIRFLPGTLFGRSRLENCRGAPAGKGSEQTVYRILQDRGVVA